MEIKDLGVESFYFTILCQIAQNFIFCTGASDIRLSKRSENSLKQSDASGEDSPFSDIVSENCYGQTERQESLISCAGIGNKIDCAI